jgi:hypothetical protein
MHKFGGGIAFDWDRVIDESKPKVLVGAGETVNQFRTVDRGFSGYNRVIPLSK